MPSQLPATRTPVSAPELAEALRVAAGAELGAQLTRDALLVLLAQWHLETGGGGFCIQWNLGNAKSVPGDGYDWTEFATTEVVHGETVHVTGRFRAFPTLAAGAADYVRLLAHRFAKAWPAVLAGDAEAFARALHDLGYYTASVDSYVRGMRARLQACALAWPAPAAVDQPIVAADDQPVFAAPDPTSRG
jgi:hypothetical protein